MARPTSSTSSTRQAMSTSRTRCHGPWRPARGPCWWLTPARVCRRRHWPTCTWLSTTIWRSYLCSIKSTCRLLTRIASSTRSRQPSVWIALTRSRRPPRRASASRRSSRQSCTRCPRPHLPRADRSKPSYSTPTTTHTEGLSSSSGWLTVRFARATASRSWRRARTSRSTRWASCRPHRGRWTSCAPGRLAGCQPPSSPSRTHESATPSRSPLPSRRTRSSGCPATRRPTPWSTADFFPHRLTSTTTSRTPSASSSSTTRPSSSSPRTPLPWVLAFGAAFSACCTWTSCKRGWRGSTGSTWW
mmetsp:Transcript_36001/g.89762  ORF Transcript_36001/g.89762 Transcript_36001/m.89762 type:complete len:302 (-) Transcript_36001:1384-2289(-)